MLIRSTIKKIIGGGLFVVGFFLLAGFSNAADLPFDARAQIRIPEGITQSQLDEIQTVLDKEKKATQQDTRSVSEKIMAASVRLVGRDATGLNYASGTVIDYDPQSKVAIVLTCGHFIRDAKKERGGVTTVDFFGPDGKPIQVPAQLGSYDQEGDVGVVYVPIPASMAPPTVAPLAPRGTKLVPGMTVQSVGCGGDDVPTLQTIKVTAIGRYLGPDNVECSGVPVQGRSGGGLFTKEGLVVGVCSAADYKDQRGIYAGPKAIQDLFDQARLGGISIATSSNQPSVSPLPMQIIQNNKTTVVYVARKEVIDQARKDKTSMAFKLVHQKGLNVVFVADDGKGNGKNYSAYCNGVLCFDGVHGIIPPYKGFEYDLKDSKGAIIGVFEKQPDGTVQRYQLFPEQYAQFLKNKENANTTDPKQTVQESPSVFPDKPSNSFLERNLAYIDNRSYITTTNFEVFYQTSDDRTFAIQLAQRLETLLFQDFNIRRGKRLGSKIKVGFNIGLPTPSSTNFDFIKNESGETDVIFKGSPAMTLSGTKEQIMNNAAHEVNHVLCALYSRCSIIRALDEGLAVLAEPSALERKTWGNILIHDNRRWPVASLLTMKEYPHDPKLNNLLYSQGAFLTEYLIQKIKKQSEVPVQYTILDFSMDIDHIGYVAAIKKYFNMEPNALETNFRRWLDDRLSTGNITPIYLPFE